MHCLKVITRLQAVFSAVRNAMEVPTVKMLNGAALPGGTGCPETSLRVCTADGSTHVTLSVSQGLSTRFLATARTKLGLFQHPPRMPTPRLGEPPPR